MPQATVKSILNGESQNPKILSIKKLCDGFGITPVSYTHLIIFRGVTVKAGAKVKNSIVMQGSVIGTGSELSYVITDKDVNIQDARMIMGFHSYPVYISKGSVV